MSSAADDARELLERFSFLADMPEDERQNMLSSIVFRHVPAGGTVMTEGAALRSVLLVLSGNVRVFKSNEDGREILLYRVGAGEMCTVTVACLLGRLHARSPVSAVATQQTLLGCIPADTFRYEYAVSPYLQRFVFRLLSDKFCHMVDLIEQLTFRSLTERLRTYLEEATDGGRRPLYTTHAQLAAALGTSREVVTRRLHELEQQGIVRTQRGKITLQKDR